MIRLSLFATARAASLAVIALLASSGVALAGGDNYRLKTLGVGSSPYVVSTVFANTVNNNTPYSIQVDSTGSGSRHAMETAMDKVQFTAVFSPGLAALMRDGKGMFESVPQAPDLYKDMRIVFYYPMGLYHAVVYADSGIESYADLRGKRVFTGPPTGIARRNVEALIEGITGFKPDRDYQAVHISWDAAAQSFQDGNIDAYFNPTLAPSPVITQIALTNKVRFLSIPESAGNDQLSALLDRPGYRIEPLAPRVYGDNQVNAAPARSIGVSIALATNRRMDEKVVYDMTKAFWENLEAQKAAVPQMRSLSLETALQDLNTPLHPGALRYYREQGLDIPDNAMPPEAR
ncbi:hypothetical protein ASALC70_04201 [Alcanivorax sp. ALC70]|nr:hypothetical protein ASALC70_04201 [Alcanivorax sp. ALC70]